MYIYGRRYFTTVCNEDNQSRSKNVSFFKFSSWKIDAQVSAVNARLSDTHLFGVMKLILSIPFPKSVESSSETQTNDEVSESLSSLSLSLQFLS
jgi:hypothetical protein